MSYQENTKLYYSTNGSIHYLDLYRECGEIPKYFTILFGVQSIIDDFNDNNYPNLKYFGNVELQRLVGHNKIKNQICKINKIFWHARNIDILYLIHIRPTTLFKMIAYRLGGGRGKIYVKLDLDNRGYMKDGRDLLKWEFMPFYLKCGHYLFKRIPDQLTVETYRSYNRLKDTYYGDLIEKGKLSQLSNGFDPELLMECGISRRLVSEKEKIIMTVGRIGSFQKNTELMLDVLTRVTLNNWRVYLVGPIEKQFLPTITLFYEQHPELKEKIIFTGSISQKDKFELYNRARVFLFTSRHEGFAFALVEATYMKNYIISTDIGGAEDVLRHTSGTLINPDDPNAAEKLALEIQRVIDLSENDLNKLVSDNNLEELTWTYILGNNEGINRLLPKIS